MRAAASFLLLLALAAPALAGERVIVVMTDGQTFEAEARPRSDGSVEVTVELATGGRQTMTLDASAIERIEPLDAVAEETVQEAAVRLADGRELRGVARVRASEVVVEGPHGKVVVPRGDVVSIAPVLPDPPRTIVDADTGLVVPQPPGWSADAAGGVGERLRLVRDDGRAWVSVLLRPLAAGATTVDEARIRAALRHDLSRAAHVARGEDGRWRVRDDLHDPSVPGTWPLHLQGVIELFDDHVIFFRLLADGGEPLDAADTKVLEDVVARRTLLREGRSKDGTLFRHPASGLFVAAPAGFRVGEARDALARVSSPADPKASLVVQALDDPDARNALLDLLDGPPEASDEVTVGAARAFRARREGERGFALPLAQGEGSVAVIARAARPEQLALLTGGVLLFDPRAAAVELDAAERLLPLIARAREALERDEPAAAATALEPVVAEYPDAPEPRALLVAVHRARDDHDALLAELDDAWVTSGWPWVARELAQALLERSRALGAAGDHAGALAAIDRAAVVWPDERVTEATTSLLVGAAKEAFAAGDETVCWARFARLRELTGGGPSVDAEEAALRLKAAQAQLDAGDTRAARRDARRAYTLGAADAAVDRIYSLAEQLDLRRERTRERERERAGAGSGDFAFGIPPTRNGRSSRIKPTAFSRPTQRGGFVQPIRRGGGGRVRPVREGQGRRVRPVNRNQGQGRRVRSNGRLVFD